MAKKLDLSTLSIPELSALLREYNESLGLATVTIPALPALVTASQQQSDVYEMSNSTGSNPSAKETRAQQIYKVETDAIAAGANISIAVGTLAPGNNSVTPAIISSTGQPNVVTSWDGSTAPVAVTPGSHITFAGGQINSDGQPNVVTSVEGSSSPVGLSAGSGISIIGGVISNTAIVANPDASYGEMYFNGNSTPTVVSGAGMPAKIQATYSSGQLLNFTQSNGTLQYTGSSPIGFDASMVASATMNLTSDQVQITIYHNGSPVVTSNIVYNLDGVSPSLKATPGQCIIPLNPGDTIECWITNLTSGNSPTVGSLNCGVKSIGGSNNVADQVVVSWNGLTTPTNVTAGAGISITGGTITSLSGSAATYQSTYDASSPATTVLAPIKPIMWQSNLTTTVPQTLYYQTDISDISNPISFDSSLSLNSTASVVNYQHKEVFILNATSGAESSLINLKAMNAGTVNTYYTYDGLNNVTEISSANTNVSNQLNVGPGVYGVNFTLGTTLLYTQNYPSGVLTSVWNTLSGTNTVLANSLAIGQTIEVDLTGVFGALNSGGTGIVQFAFGSFAVQSQIVNFNGFSGTRNLALKIKVTRVNSTQCTCSLSGWFVNPSNVMMPFQMFVTPGLVPYDASLNTDVILQWGPTYTAGNGFDLLAKNLNIIQYS